jgi:hypothetical protein
MQLVLRIEFSSCRNCNSVARAFQLPSQRLSYNSEHPPLLLANDLLSLRVATSRLRPYTQFFSSSYCCNALCGHTTPSPISQLSSYIEFDVECDAIGSIHLHGSTSPRAPHRTIPALSNPHCPYLPMQHWTTINPNVACWGFVGLQPPMLVGGERYPDKYADLWNGSVPDFTPVPSSRGYSGSFPKPIGTGRPVVSPANVALQQHEQYQYEVTIHTGIEQKSATLRDRLLRDSAASALPKADPCGKQLLAEFTAVINSIFNILATEQQAIHIEPRIELTAPGKSGRTETSVLTHNTNNTKSMHTEVPLAQGVPTGLLTASPARIRSSSNVMACLTTVMGDTEMKEGPRDPVADVFWLLMDENSVVGVSQNAMWCDIE